MKTVEEVKQYLKENPSTLKPQVSNFFGLPIRFEEYDIWATTTPEGIDLQIEKFTEKSGCFYWFEGNQIQKSVHTKD